MLCLSRKPGESVVIDGGRIVVKVTEIHCGHVHLGIEAPVHISVLREELVGREPRKPRVSGPADSA